MRAFENNACLHCMHACIYSTNIDPMLPSSCRTGPEFISTTWKFHYIALGVFLLLPKLFISRGFCHLLQKSMHDQPYNLTPNRLRGFRCYVL